MLLCPCGSSKVYDACCGRFIEYQEIPVTAEELMRSRYTAYVRRNLEYIAATMKSPASDHFNLQAALQDAKQTQWQGLEVLAAKTEGDQAQVEFKAYYQEEGRKFCLHERSDFRREGKRWYYVDGHLFPSQKQPVRNSKIQRNDPCPCGSQKKYKKCCG